MSALTSIFSPKPKSRPAPAPPVPVAQTNTANEDRARDEAAERRRRIAQRNSQQGVATSSRGLTTSAPVNRPMLKSSLGA